MKGTPGEKECLDRQMRSHQISGGGKQYRRMVSTAMFGQRPIRTALFVNSQEPPNGLSETNHDSATASQTLAMRRSMSSSVGKLTLNCVPLEMTSTPVKSTTVLRQSPALTPVRELDFAATFFHTPQSCPVGGIASRQCTRSPSSPGYAGAKFSEAPSPKVLPKPPVHWVDKPTGAGAVHALVVPTSCGFSGSCHEMTNALKGLLKVQC